MCLAERLDQAVAVPKNELALRVFAEHKSFAHVDRKHRQCAQ
jgi:hypothetical protein